MNEPPAARTCPNCGQLMKQEESVCAACGRQVGPSYVVPPAPAKQKTKPIAVVFIILFCLIGLPSCLFGGCVLMIGGGDSGAVAIGLSGIAVFALLLFLMVKSARG